ncbi:MAG: eL32 family ribosomal protein [Candidatus Thermoplasmatota archaeon]
MATKEEFVEEVSKLPGVSKKAAEALYDAGYKSLDDLKGLSKEKLTEVNGIGPKTADAVLAGIAEGEAPESAKADEVEVVEKPSAKKTKGKAAKLEKKAAKGEAEEKAEVVEPEQAYRVKIKPDLPEEVLKALQARAIIAAHEPAFKKYHWWYSGGRVKINWRAPKGELSKQRRGFKYRPPRVKVGYGKPAIARGLHATGFEEVPVHNVSELDLVADPKTQAARIGGGVGGRKRKLIEEEAGKRNIRVLNPRRT